MSKDNTSTISIRDEGDTTVIAFPGPCLSDSEQISVASQTIAEYLAEHSPGEVVFDFEHVKFFTSQVLGLILETRTRILPHAGKVAIRGLSPQLHRVFKITNIDKLVDFYPTSRLQNQ